MNTPIIVMPDEPATAESALPVTVEEASLQSSLPLSLSATRIKTFLMCPRQYRYRYVDKLPTKLTGALAFGKVVHQVIHDLHQWSILSNEPLHEQVALSKFALLWERVVEEQEPVFKGDAEMLEYSRLAEVILIGYVEAQKNKPQPFLLEFPFEIAMHDEHSSQNYLLCGVIDRIDQIKTGKCSLDERTIYEQGDGLVIVDFKTGKRKPSSRDLAFNLQLTLYAFAAREIFGQDVVEVQLYHLRDQTAFHAHRGPADMRTLLQVTLPDVVKGITSQEFPPKVGYWCRFCDFKQQCLAEGPYRSSRADQ